MMNVEGLRKDFFIYPRFIHRPQVPFVALVRRPNFTNYQCNIRAYKQLVSNRAIIVSNA